MEFELKAKWQWNSWWDPFALAMTALSLAILVILTLALQHWQIIKRWLSGATGYLLQCDAMPMWCNYDIEIVCRSDWTSSSCASACLYSPQGSLAAGSSGLIQTKRFAYSTFVFVFEFGFAFDGGRLKSSTFWDEGEDDDGWRKTSLVPYWWRWWQVFVKDNEFYLALPRRCQGSKDNCPGLEAKFATCNSVRVSKFNALN